MLFVQIKNNFYRAMERVEKRAKLDNDEPSKISPRQTEFLDMNDDCILAILESLKIDDLYLLGSTCVRINQLAADVFGRKYTDEWIDVHIKYIPKKLIAFKHPNHHAEKYFYKYFRSIRVYVNRALIRPQRIFQFVDSMCCPELKHLELIEICCKFSAEHSDLAKNKLAQLESIKINYFFSDGDIYAGILQYCKNIKCLSIQNDNNAYAFQLGYCDPRKQFHGENNPHLKLITCTYVNAKLIRSLVTTVQNLEYSKLELRYENDIGQIYDELKAACDNGRIGQLEVILSEANILSRISKINDIRRYANLRPLCTLRNVYFYDMENITSIKNMVNLQRLEMDLDLHGEKLIEFVGVLSELPKLIELKVNMQWRNPLVTLSQFCLPIVQKSPKMKTLRIFDLPYDLITSNRMWNDVSSLDGIRSAVSEAVPLTVYIKTSGRFSVEVGELCHIPNDDMVNFEGIT